MTDSIDPAQRISATGIFNFRDYGGYRGHDGGLIARRRLFRSSQHQDATDADLTHLQSLAIDHIIDMRSDAERRLYPCRRHPDCAARVVFASDAEGLSHDTAPPHAEGTTPMRTVEDAHARMLASYRTLPFRPMVVAALRLYFQALSDSRSATLVHCYAGKDRTGLAVQLFHHSMGVSADDAMADYLATNHGGDQVARVEAGRRSMIANRGADVPYALAATVMGVRADYWHTAVQEIVAAHGSMDGYLRDVIGLSAKDQARLREQYLI